MKRLLVLSLGLAVAFASCKKDETKEEEAIAISSGMVVACEGTFGMANSSIHFIYDDARVANDVYTAANGTAPGDVLQSVRVFNDKGYAIVNNSQKVEVFDLNGFSHTASITGCDYPRDVFVYNSSKGYISNGSGAGELLVFNPVSNTITGSIAVGTGPEQIAFNGSYLFVANGGGFDYDNTVSVIDPVTDQVIETVTVGDRPVAIMSDYQNNVWVLCKGHIEYDENWEVVSETQASIQRIDGSVFQITGILDIGIIGDHPEFMAMNSSKTKIYIENDEIKELSIGNGEIQTLIADGDFFGVAVHPVTGEIFVGSTPDYVSDDEVFVYSATGELLESYTVGIAPRSYVYRD